MFKRAVFLLITFVLVTLVRSFLEPKFLGSKTGLHPVAALAAIYLGFRVSGIWGMVFFPIILMLLKQSTIKAISDYGSSSTADCPKSPHRKKRVFIKY